MLLNMNGLTEVFSECLLPIMKLKVYVFLSDYLNSQKDQTTSNYSTQWAHTSICHLLTTPNLIKICVPLTVLIA